MEGSRENPWADAAQANPNPPAQYDPRIHTGAPEPTTQDWIGKYISEQPQQAQPQQETLANTKDPWGYMGRIGMTNNQPTEAAPKYQDQWMTNPDPAVAHAELQAGDPQSEYLRGDLEAEELRRQQAGWAHRQRVDAINARDALNGIPRTSYGNDPDPAGYGPPFRRGY